MVQHVERNHPSRPTGLEKLHELFDSASLNCTYRRTYSCIVDTRQSLAFSPVVRCGVCYVNVRKELFSE